MTDDVRNLIRFVVDGDIRNAQLSAESCLKRMYPKRTPGSKKTNSES